MIVFAKNQTENRLPIYILSVVNIGILKQNLTLLASFSHHQQARLKLHTNQ